MLIARGFGAKPFNKWLTRLTLFDNFDRDVVDQPRAGDPGSGEQPAWPRRIGDRRERFGVDQCDIIDAFETAGQQRVARRIQRLGDIAATADAARGNPQRARGGL